MRFPGRDGYTDEHSISLTREGVKRGCALVAIDDLYKTKLDPNEKGGFPNAFMG